MSGFDFDKSNSIFENYFDEFKVTDDICFETKTNIGKLIASSICDDRNGIPDAKKSLEDWLKNKNIFPENWILAVEKTYAKIELLNK
ncbi:MAG: hypothetical protein ACOYO1_16465 [Bacteroidales bacterium]